MPQEPKKRHSRQRQGKRRASIKLATPKSTFCQNCGNIILPHLICKQCGFYKGSQVIATRQQKKAARTQKNQA